MFFNCQMKYIAMSPRCTYEYIQNVHKAEQQWALAEKVFGETQMQTGWKGPATRVNTLSINHSVSAANQFRLSRCFMPFPLPSYTIPTSHLHIKHGSHSYALTNDFWMLLELSPQLPHRPRALLPPSSRGGDRNSLRNGSLISTGHVLFLLWTGLPLCWALW